MSLVTDGDVEIKSPDAKCDNDTLEIQDGAKGNKTKHCQDKKIEKPIQATSGVLVVSFTSDAAVVGKGFKLVVTAELPEGMQREKGLSYLYEIMYNKKYSFRSVPHVIDGCLFDNM
jgi:hypothetical protein